MTTLTPEQFAIVVREVELMFRHGDHDEFWRVVKMFADSRFNFSLKDFPQTTQTEFAKLGANRRKDYASLLDQFREICRASAPLAITLDSNVSTSPAAASGALALQPIFEEHVFGSLQHAGKSYPLVKLVTKPASSPYAVQVPICLVAGVHGDEPDGILAALDFARRFANSPQLVSNY
jgi:hypothetical protein